MLRIFFLLKQKLYLIIEKLEYKFMSQEIHYINGPETLPPPLTKEEEKDIMDRIERGDDSAREALIVHNLRLVVYIAKKFGDHIVLVSYSSTNNSTEGVCDNYLIDIMKSIKKK